MTASNKIDGVDTFNLVYVVMGIGMDGFGAPGSYNGSFIRLSEGKVAGVDDADKDENAAQGLNMDDPTVTAVRNGITAQAGAAGASAPIFQTSAGGTLWTDMSSVNVVTDPSLCLGGEYVTIYMLGLGIMVEYYNPTNPA